MNFSKKIEKILMPLASWVNKNKYLTTLAQAFTTMLPVIMTGAFALIVSKSPMTYTSFAEGSFWYGFFEKWNLIATTYLVPLNFIQTLTMGSMSLYITVCIAYTWSERYSLSKLHTIIVSVASFLLVNSVKDGATISIAYFGGEGLFSAILVAFLTVEIFKYFVHHKFGKINFPPSVPSSLEQSLGLLVPMFVILVGWALVVIILTAGFHTTIPALIMSISKPLNLAVDTIFGVSFVSSIGQLSWWFGIHNSSVLSIVKPIMYSNLAANAEAYAAGVSATQLPYIVNQAFFYHFGAIGGSGATLGLVFLLIKSKSEQMRAVGKFSLIPALFNINEPVLFGLPLVLNPIMLIPLVFVQVINLVIAYVVMSFELVNRSIFFMGGTSPIIMTQFFSTLDWRSIVLFVVLVIVDMIVWYPFFKAYEREKLAEEQLALDTTNEKRSEIAL